VYILTSPDFRWPARVSGAREARLEPVASEPGALALRPACEKLSYSPMDDSIIRPAVLGQYRAGLDMLGKAIELCPENLWLSSKYKNRFWHVAYHCVFYTHLYLHRSEADFRPWPKHVPNSNYLGSRPGAPNETFPIPEPYSKPGVQEYLQLCRSEVEMQVPLVPFEDNSGFSWLPFNKLELQFYNIRHLQHHTGQLIERLRDEVGIGVAWVRSL
jgi:hypothetical protein